MTEFAMVREDENCRKQKTRVRNDETNDVDLALIEDILTVYS